MKLKKILSLILCAAIMTTGGVYATWNYATNDADSYKANIMKPAMARVWSVTGAKAKMDLP